MGGELADCTFINIYSPKLDVGLSSSAYFGGFVELGSVTQPRHPS
jgi:hypothetical protein